jgi:hypothetical protein
MGLVQHEGGPCGVLATVQVCDIHFFLTEVSPAYRVAGDTSLQQKHRNLKALCIAPAKTEKTQKHPEVWGLCLVCVVGL